MAFRSMVCSLAFLAAVVADSSFRGVESTDVDKTGDVTTAGASLPSDTVFACGRIPASRVFDVQWSGNQNRLEQWSSGFNAPYNPSTGRRLTVDLDSDYFRLSATSDGTYVLQQFGQNGKLKSQLSGGQVALSSADVVFYIIDGWYATIITRSSEYSYGGSAIFKDLLRDPALHCPLDTFYACGHIPANRVFDVQWSGNENGVVQSCSGLDAPYNPSAGRLSVNLDSDYFQLASTSGGTYNLQQFGQNGTLKAQLSGGQVKLANANVVFYIVDGFYATIITRSSAYSYGDSASFKDLLPISSLSCPGDTMYTCGQIPANRVFDVQWSGDESNAVQRCSDFNAPYNPSVGRLAVDLASDYFQLKKTSGANYVLQQFGNNGKMKAQLPEGEVKLASAEVAFYIIKGFYATIITWSGGHKYGDFATFEGLVSNPSLPCHDVHRGAERRRLLLV